MTRTKRERIAIMVLVGGVVAAVLLYLVVRALLDYGSLAVAPISILVVAVVGGWLLDRSQKAKRSQALDRRFGQSLDNVRAHIDVEALRHVRDTRGELQAVRALRKQVPELNLAQAAELVRTL